MEKFSYEENGYNIDEVNSFVDEVIKETESVMIRVKSQRLQIEDLEKKLSHYENLEKTLNEASSKAEEAKDSMIRLANDEKELIIKEAKNEASRIINDALLRAEKIESQKDQLEEDMRTFKRNLRNILEEQLTVVEKIEKLKIDNE